MARLLITPATASRPELDAVTIEAVLPDGSTLSAASEFVVRLAGSEIADLRWYYETYPQFPEPPAPARAAAIEARIADRGAELFSCVFLAEPATAELWEAVRPHLADTAVEIVSREGVGLSILWEAMREHPTTPPIALLAREFSRRPADVAVAADGSSAARGVTRVLLVIARPGGTADVPYRAVAEHLAASLGGSPVSLEVLRPPTYERFAERLESAAAAGAPYSLVHFDGHGVYAAFGPGQGARGYLLFEDPAASDGAAPVDGRTAGELLRRHGVGGLVLNACRSAYLDAGVSKRSAADGARVAVGSFAEEAVRAGVPQVVAMRYNLYAVTAAQLIASLYRAIGAGHPLGHALTLARRDLADRPERTVGTATIALQDWVVPVLVRAGGNVADETAASALETPSGPSAPAARQDGFVGRDETFYRLDRWLDHHAAVLLWGMAGRGKTAAARAFAEWYRLTGGTTGPVVVHELTAAELSALPYDPGLQGEVWAAAEDGALTVIDVKGTLSPAAVGALRTTVGMLTMAGGKVLVTARQTDGLDDLLVPVFVPALRPTAAAELAGLATGLPPEACVRLLRVAAGHPGTIRLLGAAGAGDAALLDRLIDAAMAGTLAAFPATPETSAPIAAILAEAKRLGPSYRGPDPSGLLRLMGALRLARGFISAPLLRKLWGGAAGYAMPELAGPSPEQDLAADLLGAMVRTGLAADLSYERYALHPLLAQVVAPLHEQYFPAGSEAARRLERAWHGALAVELEGMVDAYNHGAAAVMDVYAMLAPAFDDSWAWCLATGETELLSHLLVARAMIAHQTGDLARLHDMLEQTRGFYVDPTTGGPMAGQERKWELWTSNQVRYLRSIGDFVAAEALSATEVAHVRARSAAVLGTPAEALTPADRLRLADIARAEFQRAVIAVALHRQDAAAITDEAIALAKRAGDATLAGKIEVLRLQNDPGASEAASAEGVVPITSALTAQVEARSALQEASRLIETGDDPAPVRAAAERARRQIDRALAVVPEHLAKTIATLYLDRAEASLMMLDMASGQDDAGKAIRYADRADPNGRLAANARGMMAMALRGQRASDSAALYRAASGWRDAEADEMPPAGGDGEQGERA